MKDYRAVVYPSEPILHSQHACVGRNLFGWLVNLSRREKDTSCFRGKKKIQTEPAIFRSLLYEVSRYMTVAIIFNNQEVTIKDGSTDNLKNFLQIYSTMQTTGLLICSIFILSLLYFSMLFFFGIHKKTSYRFRADPLLTSAMTF